MGKWKKYIKSGDQNWHAASPPNEPHIKTKYYYAAIDALAEAIHKSLPKKEIQHLKKEISNRINDELAQLRKEDKTVPQFATQAFLEKVLKTAFKSYAEEKFASSNIFYDEENAIYNSNFDEFRKNTTDDKYHLLLDYILGPTITTDGSTPSPTTKIVKDTVAALKKPKNTQEH